MRPTTAARFLLPAALAVACTGPPESSSTVAPVPGMPRLRPLPSPDLEGVFESMRADLDERRARWSTILATPGAAAGERAAAWGELGKLYLAAELFDAAEDCLLNAHALATADPRWPHLLGHLYRRTGRVERAIEQFEIVHERRPEDVAARVWLGELHLSQGRPAVAGEFFGSALALHPGSAAARYGLGRVALAQGRHREAIRQLEAALRVQPGATIVHYPLALAYRGLGDTPRAEEHLGRRGDVEPYPHDPLLAEIETLLDSPQRRNEAGMRALEQDRPREAAVHFRAAVTAEPDNAVFRLNLAAALHRSGDSAAALDQYRAILEREPDHAGALVNVGNLLAARGNVVAAVEHYRRALAADPALAEARLNLASELLRAGRYAEAVPHFESALELLPRSEEAWLGHAISLAALGRHREARQRAEQGLTLLPDAHRLAHVLARVLAAAGDDDLRDGQRALQLAERVWRADPGGDAAETMAMALAELARFDEAVEWQKRAISRAERAGRPEVASAMSDNLRLYRRRRPCRRPWRF